MSAMATVSYLVHYDTLLQNAENIFRKCDSILLQNSTKVYYKKRLIFFKKCDYFFIKCQLL